MVVLTRYREPVAAVVGPAHFGAVGLGGAQDAGADAVASAASVGEEPASTRQPSPEVLLERAKVGALRRIELDLERLPKQLRPVLVLLRENLFRAGLTVQQIRATLGIGGHSLTTRFHRVTGAPIRRYLEDRRLECACRLLASTRLEVSEIARLVGYRSVKVFSEAFGRRLGARPTVYRRFGGKLSLEVTQQGDGVATALPVMPRHVVGIAEATGPCGRCAGPLEPEEKPRVFEDLAPICDACAERRAPHLVAWLV